MIINDQSSHWYLSPSKQIALGAIEQAKAHQLQLTKPPGSLGNLEDIAIQFSGWQNKNILECESILICIFAGDHGVCQQGVSAFPQSVTAQMVLNFLSGGAAISVLAERMQAKFSVVNLGTVETLGNAENLVNAQIMPGTNDFTQQAAMSEDMLEKAMHIGKEQITSSLSERTPHLFIGGDMGIGNSTSASAIYSLLLNIPPEETAGPGTGVDQAGIKRKQKAIYQAINKHAENIETSTNQPLSVLQLVGGLEIAALVGAYISAAQNGIPILVDGFISTAAALLAVKLNTTVRDWMLFAHQSAEPGHYKALEFLKAKPLLDLGMRLGEGSGAAVAVPLIQNALVLHNNMATFSSAGVSEN